MKNKKKERPVINIFAKIFFTFLIVFSLYIITRYIDNFAYEYFIFPLASILLIFICGINVGKSLERMRTVTGKSFNDRVKDTISTIFTINDSHQNRSSSNKKIIKEDSEGNIHVKVFNYKDIDFDEMRDESLKSDDEE